MARPVNSKLEEHVRVSADLLSSMEFEPFEANAEHLRYFRRSESTTLPDRLPDAGVEPFDVFKHLAEPADGRFCKCHCGSGYRALPYQSHTDCKACRPPTQRCSHGVTNFERCAECKKLTGSDLPSVGLSPIILKRR